MGADDRMNWEASSFDESISVRLHSTVFHVNDTIGDVEDAGVVRHHQDSAGLFARHRLQQLNRLAA